MINVTLIPILEDNYAFLLEADNGESAIIDPGDAAPIIDVLEQKNIKPDYIFITHHHWDHIDGLPGILKWHNCPVLGPASETSRIPGMDILVEEDSNFSFGGEKMQIIETPGHTRGHISFYFAESKLVFVADLLFSMGCGRLFEGTPEQAWNSIQKITALPDDTMMYCGHEYTLGNATFCLQVEPDNEALIQRAKDVKALRAAGKQTIPTSLKLEKETNTFIRARSAEAFGALRRKKDNS